MSRTNGASVMLRIEQARAFPRALAFMLAGSLTPAGWGGAWGKSRVRKPALEQPSWETPYVAATPPQVRFFTINAVLAKHDGLSGAKPGTVQIASADASSAAGLGVASDVLPAAPVAAVTSEEPFGLFTFRAPEGLVWEKWRGVEAKMRAEAKAVEACRADDKQCAGASKKFIALA